MGVEAQNTLYALAQLGLIERTVHKKIVEYTFKYQDVNNFCPTFEQLKSLENLCQPLKMYVDSINKEIIMEYTS